jgi:hypothetical protein
MREIGYIERLQVQLDSLKKGDKPNRYYDPTALRVVRALRLTIKGVIGITEGQELLDVHHADHPYSKNRQTNAISFNLSPHYAQMQNHFGPHLEMGCAGENILIATDESFELDALSCGLIIKSQDGVQGRLTQVSVAHPCLSFSKYALKSGGASSDEIIKETLQFLDGGTRGFYCAWEGDALVVRPGDRVFIAA